MKTLRENTVIGHGDVLICNVDNDADGRDIKKFGLVDMSKGTQGYAAPVFDDDDEVSGAESVIDGTPVEHSATGSEMVEIVAEVFDADTGSKFEPDESPDGGDVNEGMENNELFSDVAKESSSGKDGE